MIGNINTVLVVAAAVFGTITAAVLGWLDSGESFNGRKFAYSMIHAIVAGILVAVGYSSIPSLTWWDILFVYLSGAGIDVLGNRLEGSIASKARPTIVAPPPAQP